MAATGPETRSYTKWRQSNPDLDTICRNWKLRDARFSLPMLIRREEEVTAWPLDLVHALTELSTAARNDRKTAQDHLVQMWHIRLGKYPTSDLNMIAQDVETVLARHRYMSSKKAQKMSRIDYLKYMPKLDVLRGRQQ